MPQLFVSYASVDRPRTMQIVVDLRGQGLDVWIDQAGIAGGTSYGTEIANALRDAGAVVLIASDASLASKNVRQEIMLAWRYDKPILPLILHPLTFPDDVAYWLEGAQWIEVFDRAPELWMPKLRQALARHGLESSEAETAEPATPTPLEAMGNLPSELPTILGREREIEEVLSLLANSHTITLTGPGGTGKTRLALEIGRRMGSSYAGGAWFLDLSAERSAELILPEIAELFGLEMPPDAISLVEVIAAGVSDRATLLILDNLEQIPEAAAPLARLQARVPTLSLVLTSRALLQLPGEWVYTVPQLALPDLNALPAPAALIDNPAVRLFVARAQLARPDFQLLDGNARAVAEICHRLDGLPLAIEIAAARARMLPPAAILTRLGSRLSLLTRGNAASARQQTLRDTIGWSYNLLDPEQQRVFRDFAVFAGGAAIDAAEAVIGESAIGEDGSDQLPVVLDLLEDLIDQALLVLETRGDGVTRVRMLETIREYALEQLDAQGAAAARSAHAGYFVTLLDEQAPQLGSASASGAIQAVRGELSNLRAALDYLKEQDDPRAWFRLVRLLFSYWRIAGPYAEAVAELEAVAQATGVSPVDRADALSALGWFAGSRGDFQAAETLFTDALVAYRTADRREDAAEMLLQLAMVAEFTGNYGKAREHHLERRAFHAEQEDDKRLARVDHDLGRIVSYQGDYEQAIPLIIQSLERYRQQNDAQMIGIALIDLATVEMLRGDAAASLAHIAESVALLRVLQDEYAVAVATVTRARALQLAGDLAAAEITMNEGQGMAEALGDANLLSLLVYTRGVNRLAQGNVLEAKRLLDEGLQMALASEDRWRIAEILERLATIAALEHRLEDAGLLLGRAAQEREATEAHIPPVNLAEHEATVEQARRGLAASEFDRLWNQGRRMDAHDFESGEQSPTS